MLRLLLDLIINYLKIHFPRSHTDAQIIKQFKTNAGEYQSTHAVLQVVFEEDASFGARFCAPD